MSRAPRSPRWALSVVACVVMGCQDGYPLAPTLCDRWCELTKDRQCGYYRPAECVVGCEQGQGYGKCEPALAALVACLDALPSSALSCDRNATYDRAIVPECMSEEMAVEVCAVRLATQGSSGSRE